MLCTVTDQPRLLPSCAGCSTPGGRLGLLVFVAQQPRCPTSPPGTSSRPSRLRDLLAGGRATGAGQRLVGDFAARRRTWQERADAVEAELERRHGDDPAWQIAGEQAPLIGRLLSDGELVGTMLVATRA